MQSGRQVRRGPGRAGEIINLLLYLPLRYALLASGFSAVVQAGSSVSQHSSAQANKVAA